VINIDYVGCVHRGTAPIGYIGCQIYPDEYRVLECPPCIQGAMNLKCVGRAHRGTSPIGYIGCQIYPDEYRVLECLP